MSRSCDKCNAAWDFVNMRRYDLAEKAFRELIVLDPSCGLVHAKLAFCLLRLDKKSQALFEAKEGIRLSPWRDYCHWAMYAVHLESGSFRKAEAAILEAIRLAPNHASYHTSLARVYSVRREWNAALQAAERATTLDPLDAEGVRYRAYVLGNLGRTAAAMAAIETALALDPQDADIHATLGWLQLWLGDLRKAKESLKEALRLDPTHAWARGEYATALARERRLAANKQSSIFDFESSLSWGWPLFMAAGLLFMAAGLSILLGGCQGMAH